MDLSSKRKEYVARELSESLLPVNPLDLFDGWYKEAESILPQEANAMILSTSGKDRRVSSRVVLLKEYNSHGFVFFTNYQSKKGHQIAENPASSLLFFWPELERQVRIEGRVKKLPESVSDRYWESRPFESKIASLISQQSFPVGNREKLDSAYQDKLLSLSGKSIPRPEHWGGLILVPALIEFWQGRKHRLHDRIEYRIHKGKWEWVRLSP